MHSSDRGDSSARVDLDVPDGQLVDVDRIQPARSVDLHQQRGGRSVDLQQAVDQRRHHRREPGSIRCIVCHERHPCKEWRRARAVVLVYVRRAFAAARAGERL